MELLLSALTASMIGYLITRLETIENKLNKLENTILVMRSHLPKRKDDDYEL
jgi:hypothetical protein